MLFAEGPTACPFVALESDRDRRAAEPDPRHRCYAEPLPAPRALAHQREFCLAPEFGRCPIFQDWAVRAAARPVPLRPLGAQVEEPPAQDAPPAGPQQLPAFGGQLEEPAAEEPQPAAEKPLAGDAQPTPPLIPPPYSGRLEPEAAAGRSIDPAPIERLPSLPLDAPEVAADTPDVAEPDTSPPAAAKPAAAQPPAAEPTPDPEPPQRRRWTEDWPPSAAAAAAASASSVAPELAARRDQAPAPSRPSPPGRPQVEVGRPLRTPRGRREAQPPSRREEWSSQRADLIPAWERERYSAYPSLRTRVGLGDGDALLSRLTRILAIIAIGALVIALIILAPGFFAGGPVASPTPGTSPSPSGPTPSPTPTITPQPTLSFEAYVVQAGDSLSAIAVRFGILPCQIQAANPEITDPNQIFIGQVILIPPDDFALEECLVTPAASP